jgi:hypothetical protein
MGFEFWTSMQVCNYKSGLSTRVLFDKLYKYNDGAICMRARRGACTNHAIACVFYSPSLSLSFSHTSPCLSIRNTITMFLHIFNIYINNSICKERVEEKQKRVGTNEYFNE